MAMGTGKHRALANRSGTLEPGRVDTERFQDALRPAVAIEAHVVDLPHLSHLQTSEPRIENNGCQRGLRGKQQKYEKCQ